MCGIVGFAWKNDAVLRKVTDSMAHRGPDAAGYWSDDRMSLGHRRLSIIDLNPRSNQPLHLGHLHISFNGEIYNYKDLKAQLPEAKFVTDSDTEMILHAYNAWGSACVERFRGMWALAIYDDARGTVFLSRDRFGVKPLYYTGPELPFSFASEVQVMRQLFDKHSVSEMGLNLFFYQKYITQPFTIYEQVYKLPPATNLFVDLQTGTFRHVRYYSPVLAAESGNVATHLALLKNAVAERLVADVPVGSFLSGGLDSSLIAALAKEQAGELHTFSIGFPQASYNELKYAQGVADFIGSKHKSQVLDITDAFLEESMHFVGEPFGDASYIPTRLLAGITRKDVTVALSGDAADEIYGGYDTYRAFMLAQYYPHFAHKFLRFVSEILPEPNRKVSAILKMKRFFRTYSPDVVERHFDWMATYADEGRKDLLLKHFRNKYEFNLFDSTEGNGLRDVQVADLSHYLSSGILQKVDMASMSCGLEVRVPFLSPDVVAQALALPDSLKITLRHRKIRLKEMAVGYIPDWVGKRPKRGFTSPLRVWFQRSELLREYVLGEKYFEHGFFERDFAERLFVSNLSGDDCSRELWLLFGFNFWYYHKFLGM